MFILEDKHLEVAKEIAQRNRHKKSCDHCYDRGWIGVSEQNLLVLCPKCVDMEKALEEWKNYVSEHEELKEHFSELFEEKKVETEQENPLLQKEREHTKNHPSNQQKYVPGQKRAGHQKKIG
ncbi:MAG: hypothetical protein ABFC98_03235 [Candidatus Cloacimonas sp.]